MTSAKNSSIVGFTTGVFDIFHIGHLNILKNSKAMCDILIVGVCSDQLLLTYKNKLPVVPLAERMEIVRSIKYVDLVVVQENLDKYNLWEILKFDIYFHGDDTFRDEKWQTYEMKLKKVGVKMIYFPYTKTTNSTLIKDKITHY